MLAAVSANITTTPVLQTTLTEDHYHTLTKYHYYEYTRTKHHAHPHIKSRGAPAGVKLKR